MSESGDTPVPAAGFAVLLRLREFRLLWLAQVQSLLGDQLARVALSVLVYDRTRSALATSVVYALSFLPALLGSVLLGPLADRLPRRALLIGADLIRAAIVAVMVLPGLPVAVLAALLVLAVLVGAPWQAAESALVVDILTTEDYALGLGLRSATGQAAQLAGFAVGGVTVAALGARGALGVDAVTFLISAVLIRLGVRNRPALAHHRDEPTDPARRWLGGAMMVLRDRRLRLLLFLSWVLGLLVVPEGLAAPYAQTLGGGPRTVGLLLAAGPAGVLVGTVLYARWLSAPTRASLLGPFAAAAGLPLLACASYTRFSHHVPAMGAQRRLHRLPGAGRHRIRRHHHAQHPRPRHQHRLRWAARRPRHRTPRRGCHHPTRNTRDRHRRRWRCSRRPRLSTCTHPHAKQTK